MEVRVEAKNLIVMRQAELSCNSSMVTVRASI